jgi:hypothetical protein
MPNWVMNQLTCIFQTQEEYIAFKNKANTEGLYDCFFPMPEVLVGTSSPHLAPGDFINAVNKRKNTNFITLEEVASCDDEWDAHRAKEIIQNIKAKIITKIMEAKNTKKTSIESVFYIFSVFRFLE